MQNSGGIFRFLFLLLGAFLLFRYFGGSKQEGGHAQGIRQEAQLTPSPRAAYQYCEIKTDRFVATLTTRGATLTHFKLTTPKYTQHGAPIDLSTTPHPGVALSDPDAENPNKPGLHEFRQQLFVQWRNPTSPQSSNAPWNVAYDSMDYALLPSDGKRCDFVYKDAQVQIEKSFVAADTPYGLLVKNTITNLAAEPRRHAMAIDTAAWRLTSEVKGKAFRVSPYVTRTECKIANDKAVRLLPDAFEPDDFKEPPFAATQPWGWYQVSGRPSFTAISNAYFSQALAPVQSPNVPECQLQIENRFNNDSASDPSSGNFYRARLAFPDRLLQPGGSDSYEVLAYVGPKERQVLAEAGNATHELSDLIDLGFFTSIAKVLVGFLLAVHSVLPNWGVAVVLLTFTARLILFPLMWPGIKNMIRMRELKPELDQLNEKFKDDARAKGVAQMELYRKHNVNLFMGCLPTLLTMPVWFALYTTLQTAVELYNIPFLWFPDMSQPDPYFVLPFVIGATYFVQQKVMPMQGDPVQQKMMMYFMPSMFTVFMLFLPSGLGVYMFTNSVLGIVQQQAVERHVRRTVGVSNDKKKLPKA
ncbi:MAG TPA: membrane protein insertase YidC [Polyangiaceae bacterium]|nr:membrane protein insertase YidC [Polyangiaceae bacterium]